MVVPRSRYSDNARVLQFYQNALERVRGIPGVQSAAAVATPLLALAALVLLGLGILATRSGRTPGEVRAAGPDLGAQTLSVLGTLLGLDADQLATLRERNVI